MALYRRIRVSENPYFRIFYEVNCLCNLWSTIVTEGYLTTHAEISFYGVRVKSWQITEKQVCRTSCPYRQNKPIHIDKESFRVTRILS